MNSHLQAGREGEASVAPPTLLTITYFFKGVFMKFIDVLFIVFLLLTIFFFGFALGIVYTHDTYIGFINSFCELIPLKSFSNTPSLVTP